MTDLVEREVACEAIILKLISQQPTSPHCTLLLDSFITSGKGSAGQHSCFSMPVYGGNVKAMMKARTTRLPLPLVKRIVLHLLRGIVHTHGRGVVHTDIKPDNILFSTTMTTDDIEAWVVKDPSRRHAPEASHDGIVQTAVSQPLPMISDEEAMRATYVLADFGCGMRFYQTLSIQLLTTDFSQTYEPSRPPHHLTARSATTRGIPWSSMGHARGYLDFRLSSTCSALDNKRGKSNANSVGIRTGCLTTSLSLPAK